MYNVWAYEIEVAVLENGQMVAISHDSAQWFNYFPFRIVFSLCVFNPTFSCEVCLIYGIVLKHLMKYKNNQNHLVYILGIQHDDSIVIRVARDHHRKSNYTHRCNLCVRVMRALAIYCLSKLQTYNTALSPILIYFKWYFLLPSHDSLMFYIWGDSLSFHLFSVLRSSGFIF